MIEKLKKVNFIPFDMLNDLLFLSPSILEYEVSNRDVYIIGDLHQDSTSLFKILEYTKFFEKDVDLIFLGDYVDRGADTWLINKLLVLKYEYPERVFLLRGNHEISPNSPLISPKTNNADFFNRLKTLQKEHPEKITNQVIEFYEQFFETLPIMMKVKFNDINLLLTHGGIPRINLEKKYPSKLEQFLTKNSPIGIRYINDFLWNDIGDDNYTSKIRYQFSKDEFFYFLEKFEFDYLIRSHEFVEDGYRFDYDERVITIFSNGSFYPNSDEENVSSYYNSIGAVLKLNDRKIYQIGIDDFYPIKTLLFSKYKKKM